MKMHASIPLICPERKHTDTHPLAKYQSAKNNKRPNGPVLLTWFLSYMFLYQTMTKGCSMPNMNAFRPVVHKEDIPLGHGHL